MTYPGGLLGGRSSRVSAALDVFGGRVLGSEAINRSPNAWSPTAYNREGLIVSTADPRALPTVSSAVREVLADHDCAPDGPSWLVQPSHTRGRSDVLAAGVRIVPSSAGASGAPDPWAIVEELRSRLGSDLPATVGLNHLMTSAEQFGGNPFAVGHGRVGLDGYGLSGSNGHGPVTLAVGPPPASASSRSAERRPRVVVLDTGIGDHPWFRSAPARTTITFADGSTVGPDITLAPGKASNGGSDRATADPLLGALPTHAGHGTFIAGLLRQACPEAEIVALTVMQANGIVPEHKLIRALELLLRRQSESPGWADAIVLSLGYYAETGEDLRYTSGMKDILLALGRRGVAVFAAAGNDASRRPSYPAALAVDPDFAADEVVPVVSVAALNADGTVAPFSNEGPWVTAEAVGANLVSAAPRYAEGGARAAISVRGPRGAVRSSFDLDDFRGYAVWSGTSFAAPVLAGRYLTSLQRAEFPPHNTDRRALLPVGRPSHQLQETLPRRRT